MQSPVLFWQLLAREVAGCVVSSLFFFQWRNDLAANLLSFPTTRVEVTATWRIDRAWYVALQDDAAASFFDGWIWHRDGGQQCLCVRMKRCLVELLAI